MPSYPTLSRRRNDRRAIALWLLCCLLLVAAMVMLGGYTRLSGSGLSITEWKPIHGVIPPLGEAEWQEEFARYRESPQFEKVNSDMDVEGFKRIFWPEYLHRLLGRAVGVVFFVPFLIFLARKSIGGRFAVRLAFTFALGGLQGLIGWYMVKSGLVDMPRVSHLRLALHLAVAFVLFGLLLWSFLDVRYGARSTRSPPQRALARRFEVFLALLFVQIILGAFMAGLHAGLIYNTYPTMNGDWLPPEVLHGAPEGGNVTENIALVQFLHRWMAAALVAAFAYAAISGWKDLWNRKTRLLIVGCFGLLALQFTLGVLTLLYQVPLGLALKHQSVALLLFALTIALIHRIRCPFQRDPTVFVG